MRGPIGVVLVMAAVLTAAATLTRLEARQVEPNRVQEQEAGSRFDLSRLNRWIDPADRYFAEGYETDRSDKWEVVIDDVPFGRWLVLTDISIGRSMAAALICVQGKERRGLLNTTPYRDHKGPWAEHDEFTSYHSETGVVLPPGSKLVIANGGIGNPDIGWRLTGYFVDVD